MSKYVKIQKTKVVQSKRDSSRSEHSPYWEHMGNAADIKNAHNKVGEYPQANPDVLPETEVAAPSTPQLIMGEAVEHLQGRQKEVYFLTMREDKSLAEAAEILGIEKGSAQKYRERAIKFIQQYCKNAMAKGRV